MAKNRTNNPVPPESDEHDEQDSPNGTGGKMDALKELVQRADDSTRRYRRGLAPVVTGGVIWGVGEGLDAIANAVPLGGLYTTLGSAAIGAGALWLERREDVLTWMGVETDRQAVWTRVTTMAATGWLSLIGPLGSGPLMHELLMGLGTLVAIPWWWRFRARVGTPILPPPLELMPAPEPEAEEEEMPQEAVDHIWEEMITAPGGPLAGAYIDAEIDQDGWEQTECGRTTGFRLPDNASILVKVAMEKTAHVTQLYKTKRLGDIVIERHEDRYEGHMRITVLNKTAIEEVCVWEGPQIDPETWDGVIELGSYIDGSGMAAIRLFKKGYGCYHTLVCGGTGSGKTSVVSIIIAAAEHSEIVQTWVYEPEDNRSLTTWTNNNRLRRTAFTYEDAFRMAKAAQAVMAENIKYTSSIRWQDPEGDWVVGKDVFEPTRERPMLLLVLDEAHVPLAEPAFAKLIADIAKRGRKGGVALLVVTQTPTMKELGGEPGGPIRTNITMGNAVVLRTTSRTDKMMLSLPFDPVDLPDRFPPKPGERYGEGTHGIGFIKSPAADRQDVIFRSMWDENAWKWAKTSPKTPLHPDAERAAEFVFSNPDLVIGGDGAELPSLPPMPSSPPPPSGNGEETLADAKTRVYAYLAENGPTVRKVLIDQLGVSPAHISRILKNGSEVEGDLLNDGNGVYCIA